jgi:hypothetical protein
MFIRPFKFARSFIKDPKNTADVGYSKIKNNYKSIFIILIVILPAFLISCISGIVYGFAGYIYGAAIGVFLIIFSGQTYSLFEKLYKKWARSRNPPSGPR